MIFNSAIDFVLKWEGGDTITDDPDDPGGLTKYGISKRAHPDVDIRNLTERQARDIYLHKYWMPAKVNDLPDALKLAQFDAAVNTGVNRANKLLQKALKVEADGIVGPITIKAAHDKGGSVLASLLAYRALFYVGLVTKRPSNSKYLLGWFRRIFDLAIETGKQT